MRGWKRLDSIGVGLVEGLPGRPGPVVAAGSSWDGSAFAVYTTVDRRRARTEAYRKLCERVPAPTWRVSRVRQPGGWGPDDLGGRAVGLVLVSVRVPAVGQAHTVRRLGLVPGVTGWVPDDADPGLVLVWVAADRPGAVDSVVGRVADLPGARVRMYLATSADRIVSADGDHHRPLTPSVAGGRTAGLSAALVALPMPAPSGVPWVVTVAWNALDERDCVTVPGRWVGNPPVGARLIVGDVYGNTAAATLIGREYRPDGARVTLRVDLSTVTWVWMADTETAAER